MKKTTLLLLIFVYNQVLALAQQPLAQQKTINPVVSDLSRVNYNTLQLNDLSKGSYKSQSTYNKMRMLANMPKRFKPIPRANAGVKQGNSPNGIRYFIGRDNIQLPSNTNGNATLSRDDRDILVCESRPVGLGKQFVSSLVGIPSSQSDESLMIYPGSLFRDEDLVQGKFIPVTLPRRNATLAINVVSGENVVETVSNYNDKNTVNAARSRLLSRVGSAAANTDHFSASFEVKSSTELSMNLETSFKVDLEAILGLPASLGSTIGSGVVASTDFNTAIAYIRNINYTLSVGGDTESGGPNATIEGNIPSNVVCVTDVMYGSISFIIVRNLSTRAEAKLVADELLDVALAGNFNRSISAKASAAFSSSAVSVMVYGGAGASSVNSVTSLQQLRTELSKGNNTVLGVNAMPLYYSLFYAADNAPVKIASFASFTNTECFKASRLEVSLTSFRPTEVVDFGDEELYGSFRIQSPGNGRQSNNFFWIVPETGPVPGKKNTQIGGTVTDKLIYDVNPRLVNFENDRVRILIDVFDKIMAEEALGASDQARRNGFVRYTPGEFNVLLADIVNAGARGLTRTFTVREGAAAIAATVKFQLVP